MGQQLTGVHVFEKLGPIEWEDELIAIQAISALTWKKHHGRIELYCNEEHLESLKKWGVDKIYDKIDTSLLSTAPKNIDRNEYWTFCKIYVSANLKPPFVLVDNDLWITDELNFDTSKSFVAYHEENYDWSKPYNFYVNFDNFIPEKYINYFDLNVKPTNVALLFWNDEELLKSWYDIVYEILNENRNCELSKLQKMTFLEQWLLPMNAVKNKKDYSTILPQVYNSHINGDVFHPELWSPPVSGWNETHYVNFNKIKHVWGLKRYFSDQTILREVFETLLISAKKYILKNSGDVGILNFIKNRAGIIPSKKNFNDKSLKVMYFIPSIITDNQTNILLKRVENLYNSNYNIEIFVVNFLTKEKNNQTIINKIIGNVGSDNYLTCKKDLSSVYDLIGENKIDVCQYEISNYDVDYNTLMNEVFLDVKIKTIKSENGINLISNLGNTIKIDYPLLNNVISNIPDVDYEFDINSLPLHVKIQNKILYTFDYTHKHIICLVDDIYNIPNRLYHIIDSFKSSPNVQFNFFNFIDSENEESNKVIYRLSTNTKIWLENLDYTNFILLSDLVLDFTSTYNTITLDCISYGIPIIKTGQLITNSEFEISLPNNNLELISKIKDNLFNHKKRIIPTKENTFNYEYNSYYVSIKNT